MRGEIWGIGSHSTSRVAPPTMTAAVTQKKTNPSASSIVVTAATGIAYAIPSRTMHPIPKGPLGILGELVELRFAEIVVAADRMADLVE